MSVDRLIRLESRLSHLGMGGRLLLTVAAVLGMAFLRWLFRDWLSLLPFLPFFPVVVACAFLFGTRYAHMASLLAFGIAVYAFVPPEFSFRISASAWVASGLFLLVLMFTGWSVGTLKRVSVQLYAAERSKAVLFNELNHRTKNNLQMVSSLLTLEAGQADDPTTRQALADAISRIGVIGQIHTLLYQDETADAVDAAEFIGRLCAGLQSSFVGARPITIRAQVEPVRLPLDTAIPLGIIINEAVTNALRHAFPGNRRGEILISLQAVGGAAVLIVADDGVGVDPAGGKGLGSRLIEAMGGQIRGAARTSERLGGGTEVVVRVPLR